MAFDKLPTIRTMQRNIVHTFDQSSSADMIEGLEWYDRAQREAQLLAARIVGFPQSVEDNEQWSEEVAKAAGVLAVLSPRLSWPKNVELARKAYVDYNDPDGFEEQNSLHNWPGLKANAKKAFRILSGENPDEVVSGPKVRPFWLTIVDPTDPRTVVVDRHAFDVAVNKVLTDEVRGKVLGRKGAYDAVATAYTRAAAQITREGGSENRPVTPAGVQAVTWVTWRKTRAAAYHADKAV